MRDCACEAPEPQGERESRTSEGARARLLAAAAKVYALFGHHGATTRRIAHEAGVNEVTIFRLFGSKNALLDEAIERSSASAPRTPLPEEALDPLAELTAWCRMELERLRMLRDLLQQCFADTGDHRRRAGELVEEAAHELCRYTSQLDARGLTHGDGNREAAVTMLLSALLADALGGEELREMLPERRDDVAAQYAAAFLAALGYSSRGRGGR